MGIYLDRAKEENIKICPFCGKSAKLISIGGINFKPCFQVACNNESCFVMPRTDVFDTKEEAINKWNIRV